MNLQELLSEARERRSNLQFQMNLHSGLISHNLIVEVGAYFVCTSDCNNKIATLKSTVGKELPSQWTQEGYEEIKNKCEWKNLKGELMKITAIGYKKWYRRELESTSNLIEFLEKAMKK